MHVHGICDRNRASRGHKVYVHIAIHASLLALQVTNTQPRRMLQRRVSRVDGGGVPADEDINWPTSSPALTVCLFSH
jgi:hypothetical protein